MLSVLPLLQVMQNGLMAAVLFLICINIRSTYHYFCLNTRLGVEAKIMIGSPYIYTNMLISNHYNY